ncbi:alginate O-acetyltransferase complex protein AlgJ [Shimia isoporae]|uniref:Alginate O-acetyltransferase complex protein AlgJ n=1 Tax=Shimia isoporae TaxID=647720 RepID=A0A4V2Q3W9_9RHOB|nr:hypothetical protein [Shimia isoporae]TCL08830.1 alginate O-acetyltransferase complex protein AlgJ [Shimia isoporae]
MQSHSDTISTLCIVALTVVFSLGAISNTHAGDPTHGWLKGTYQRGYESRFERSVPANDGAVALWAAVKWSLFQEMSTGAVASKDGWLFTAEEFSEPGETRDLREELARVGKILAKYGISLVPVIVPDKARMHEHHLARGRSEKFASRYDRALSSIKAAGLVGVDLRDALSFPDSFKRTDTHWSPEGARRAALEIAAVVSIYDFPHTNVTTVETGSVLFEGDLIAFVPTGQFRARVGPPREYIKTFETSVTPAGDLFQEVTIPVALVGTSFSAKQEFHFEGFLKQALQADVLNASSVGQGPFVPMDTFLDEISKLSSLPSVVVWEIPERFLSSQR